MSITGHCKNYNPIFGRGADTSEPLSEPKMNKADLDRYITGNYGEDQFKDEPSDDEIEAEERHEAEKVESCDHVWVTYADVPGAELQGDEPVWCNICKEHNNGPDVE